MSVELEGGSLSVIEEKHGGIFGLGLPNDAFAKYFTGKSYINKLTSNEAFMPMSNVTFEPGCRNNWHIHNSKFPIGQVLLCVDGEGWYVSYPGFYSVFCRHYVCPLYRKTFCNFSPFANFFELRWNRPKARAFVRCKWANCFASPV